MDWSLFSFSGRYNRARYWLVAAVLTGILLLGVILIVIAKQGGASRGAVLTMALSLAVMYLLSLWPSLATSAKRLHDRDKSAWWLIIFYVVPIVLQSVGRIFMFGAAQNQILAYAIYLVGLGISFWAFVEVGCLRGTHGDNRYGHDPLGGGPEQIFE